MILDYEIILSYSTSYNALGYSGKGWVFQFKKYLEATLIQITGNKPKIILHSEDEVIEPTHYRYNTFIIMVVSPDYFSSGICENEISGLKSVGFDNKDLETRIFKIIRFPVDDSLYPIEIRHIIPYPFYKDESLKYHLNMDEWHPDLCLNMLDLTFQIQKRVEEKSIFNILGNIKSPPKKVYLAFTGKDLLTHREIVYRELVRQNIEVRPKALLSGDFSQLENEIKQEMQNCELSIHLIGEDYGSIPVGTDRSIVDIQNRIAVEISSNPFRDKMLSKQFSRFVWIKPDLKKINEKQKIFIENIKRDTKSLKEDEILQVPFDELKDIIQHKIVSDEPVENFSPTSSDRSRGKGTVYLIYEKIDQHYSNEIAAHLEMEGYDVIFPDFSSDQLLVRKKHQEYLRTCDATLIICGQVNIEWINIKLQELVKAPGFGRTKPFKAKALYIKNDNHQQIHKKLMNLEGSIILEGSSRFIPDDIFLFLNKITA